MFQKQMYKLTMLHEVTRCELVQLLLATSQKKIKGTSWLLPQNLLNVRPNNGDTRVQVVSGGYLKESVE